MKGLELLKAGDAEEAHSAFSAALETDETHVASRLQLAHLDEARGDWNAAVSGFNDVIALDPSQVEARVRLAHLMVQAKDFATVERYARTALELSAEDAEVLAALAMVDQAEGDSVAASDWADRALALDPANWTARLVKARVAANAGEVDAALGWVDALLAEKPADMDAYIVKMRVLSSASRDAGLRAHVGRMADMFPDLWMKEWLVELREQAGDTACVYEMLKAVSDQQPGNAQVALDVVDFVQRSQDVEAVRTEFGARIAAADAPAARQLRLELAALEEAEGRPEEAAKVLSALIAEAPDSAEGNAARLRMARRHLASGDRGEARKMLDVVLEEDPRWPEALGLRASMLLDDGKADDAEVLRLGLAEAPADVELSLMLARALKKNGSPALAQESYATATQTSDFNPGVVAAYAEFLRIRTRPRPSSTCSRQRRTGIRIAPRSGRGWRRARSKKEVNRSERPSSLP